MTTSVAVFPPGFRVTDANDNPVPGATIEFYSAATTTPSDVVRSGQATPAPSEASPVSGSAGIDTVMASALEPTWSSSIS